MRGTQGRPAGRFWPGLTMIELLVAIALLGVTGAVLLPHLAPNIAATSNERDAYSYIGIGAVIHRNSAWDGCPRIHHPFAGAPAEAAGLMPGDSILAVDGVSTQSEGVGYVVGMIRGGAEGTPVQLTVRHDNPDSQPFTVTVFRQRIHVPSGESTPGV
jgi:prepilin-type N-terminal cleavage/methylation domain-containing protein